MSLLLLLACLCGAAARGAPTAPRCLPESELEGYCRSRRLDGEAPLINGGEGLEPAPANGTAPPVSVNADGQFLANDITIREAVSQWFSDRAAGEATYGHISTWATGGVTDMAFLFCVREDWMDEATVAPPLGPRRRRDDHDPGVVRRPRRGRRPALEDPSDTG